MTSHLSWGGSCSARGWRFRLAEHLVGTHPLVSFYLFVAVRWQCRSGNSLILLTKRTFVALPLGELTTLLLQSEDLDRIKSIPELPDAEPNTSVYPDPEQPQQASKALQSKATDLSNALKRLKICLEELERYRHEFVNLKMEANSVAEKWSITPEFSKTRQRKVKRHFDELCEDERLQDPEGFLTMLFLHRKASKWKMNMKSPIRIERRPMPSSGTYMYRLRLMMELEGGHRNSVIKRRNPIEFGLVSFVLTSTLILYGNQRLMMELEGGHRNSVIKRRNPIEFGLVFNDAKESEECSEDWKEVTVRKWSYEGRSRPPELSLTEQNATTEAVTSHLFSVKIGILLV
ncbi:hypothetical protein EVAR_47806_1 [Eumeta japonica]|uniref:Uncharacterized protein n=1 Tax=Eumeta variegata TaxID=151549 RepID=A0A4C1ZBV0_EUMVA|nr:hypothetical protein EVAR_47806_1 [Eumeta japonica]